MIEFRKTANFGPGSLSNHSFEGSEYGELLLEAQNYSYQADGWLYNFGYTLQHGMVFSGLHREGAASRVHQIWHIIPDKK